MKSKLRLDEKRFLRNWTKLQSLINPIRGNEKINRELVLLKKQLKLEK